MEFRIIHRFDDFSSLLLARGDEEVIGWLQLLARWRLAVIIIIILAIAGTIHFTSFYRPRLSLVEEVVREIIAPLQTGVMRVNRSVESLLATISQFSTLQHQNQELEREVLRLQQQVYQLADHKRENQRLREALDFQSEVDHRLLVSEVIGRSPTNWLSTITINNGSIHGVKQGMAVVSGLGIVGTVHSVSPRTATVILSVDPQSAVGGLVQSTGDLVLVEGDPDYSGLLMAKPLGRDVCLHVDDIIMTSGLSRMFPKGLPVGRVVDVIPGRYDLSFMAYIEPFVDFTRLEYVFVVLQDSLE